MAWTSVGFDGTITEIQWAGLSSLLGNGYVAAGNGDCVVTAVGGARSVSVAAGSLYGDGVLSTNSGAETVAMTTPVNGQWYVISLRRTWATNTAALVAIAGATTTTTTPTAPPTSFPVLNTNVGVLTDQPIAWAWCNSANTTVVVYDIRLKAVKSLPPVVASAVERDAKFMSPTQGLQVWRDDLGAVETYYTAYNSSTNPGGRDTAGWYVTNRSSGLMPVKPPTVTIATGSGTANALGVVSFTGASKVSLDGIFTLDYDNYKVVLNCTSHTDGAVLLWRYIAFGSEYSYAYYSYRGLEVTNTGVGQYGLATQAQGRFGYGNSTVSGYSSTFEFRNPRTPSKYNQVNTDTVCDIPSNGAFLQKWASYYYGPDQFTGLSVYHSAGTFTGTIQVFGYND